MKPQAAPPTISVQSTRTEPSSLSQSTQFKSERHLNLTTRLQSRIMSCCGVGPNTTIDEARERVKDVLVRQGGLLPHHLDKCFFPYGADLSFIARVEAALESALGRPCPLLEVVDTVGAWSPAEGTDKDSDGAHLFTVTQHTMRAFADCNEEQSSSHRMTIYHAVYPVNRKEAAELMDRALGGESYNRFRSELLLQLPAGSRVRLAREGSVAVYAQTPGYLDVKEVKKEMKADSVTLERDGAMPLYRIGWA